MELMTREPEAPAQMEQGVLSVAKAAAIETHVRQEVRAGLVVGRGAESELRRELVTELRSHSVRATKQALEARAGGPRLVDAPVMRTIAIDSELEAMLERVRELKGQMLTQEMLKLVLEDFLKRHDPLRKQPKRRAPALDPARDAELARGLRPAARSTTGPAVAASGSAPRRASAARVGIAYKSITASRTP